MITFSSAIKHVLWHFGGGWTKMLNTTFFMTELVRRRLSDRWALWHWLRACVRLRWTVSVSTVAGWSRPSASVRASVHCPLMPAPVSCLLTRRGETPPPLHTCTPLADHSLTTGWPLSDHWVTIEWPLTDHSLTTEWPLGGHSLTTHWPLTDHSLTAHWPLTGHSLTTYWPLTDHSLSSAVLLLWLCVLTHGRGLQHSQLSCCHGCVWWHVGVACSIASCAVRGAQPPPLTVTCGRGLQHSQLSCCRGCVCWCVGVACSIASCAVRGVQPPPVTVRASVTKALAQCPRRECSANTDRW